jgi:hypothetical protein
MNKTAYKPTPARKREILTQTNFRKHPHSPIRSQKSFDDSSLKTELLISKQYRTFAATQPSLRPTGASTI